MPGQALSFYAACLYFEEDRFTYEPDSLLSSVVFAIAVHVILRLHGTSQRALSESTSITVMSITARGSRNTAIVSVATMDHNVASSTLLVRSNISEWRC